MVLNNIGEAGQIKRKVYQRRLPEDPSKDYYYILRETNSNEPILIEYGFIDNANDAQKLSNNIKDYAEAVVKAIAEYLGYPYSDDIDNNTNEYTVKRGDTLYSISRKFNMSVQELKELNNLTTDTLQIGQVLKLKDTPAENEIYTVKKGDTLYSISREYNIPVNEIIRLNNLKTTTLQIGQKLYIGKEIIEEPPEELPESPSLEEYDIYIVEKGDSLWKIANKYNITVPKLIDINNLDNITLQIGQKLLVPKNNTLNNIYIVKSGDTLWSISKRFNLSVQELKELNNLDSNLLSVGQQLILK